MDDFIIDHSHFLGKKILLQSQEYTIAEFYQQPLIVKKEKELVKLSFVLIHDKLGEKRYVEVKRVFDSFIHAMELSRKDASKGDSDIAGNSVEER